MLEAAPRHFCILTNQIREKIGVMFGSPETQPGGRALKFYASQRLDIRRIETLKDGNEAVGNRVRVKVVQNKVAAPFRQGEFDIEFGKGISTEGCLIDLGLEYHLVTKSGSFFSYGEERLGQGRNNARIYLVEHPELAKAARGADLRGCRGAWTHRRSRWRRHRRWTSRSRLRAREAAAIAVSDERGGWPPPGKRSDGVADGAADGAAASDGQDHAAASPAGAADLALGYRIAPQAWRRRVAHAA